MAIGGFGRDPAREVCPAPVAASPDRARSIANLLMAAMRGHPASANSDRRRLDGRDYREIERAMARLGVAGVYAIEMHGVKVIFHNHRAAPEAQEIPAQVPPQPAEAQAAPLQPSGRLQKRKALLYLIPRNVHRPPFS